MHHQTVIGPHLILEVQQQQQENGTSVSPSMPVVIGICPVGQVASNTTQELQAIFKSTFSPNISRAMVRYNFGGKREDMVAVCQQQYLFIVIIP